MKRVLNKQYVKNKINNLKWFYVSNQKKKKVQKVLKLNFNELITKLSKRGVMTKQFEILKYDINEKKKIVQIL